MPRWSLIAFDVGLDPERLAADCARWGMDAVVLHPGHLADDRFVAALRRRGLATWLNVPVFFAPDHLARHPDDYAETSLGHQAVRRWLHMVCPTATRFRDVLLAECATLLGRVRPDVVSLDFLRCFVFWEEVPLGGDPAAIEDGCYCPRCLEAFGWFAGDRPARAAGGGLVREQWPAWAAWKVERITETAAQLAAIVRERAPGVPLYVKTIPWRQGELAGAARRVAGQDLERLAAIGDGVIPMAFAHILGQGPAWKAAVLDEARRRSGREVPSYVQVQTAVRPEPIPLAQLEAELQAAEAQGRERIVFHYEQLAADPVRAELVRRWARGAPPGALRR